NSRVTAGNQETLCALIHGPTEPISLNITLNTEFGKSVILEEDVKEDFYRCLSFQVPTVPRRTVASIHVTIQGENASLGKKTKVLFEPPAFIHVVQTDKPIYKPGQTVQFRIVSLDANFIPVSRVDPNSNRIAQWLDKAIVSGILDLSHPMIPEAVQGTYTITALTDKGEQISHSFDIKEYVLPKFEVNVKLPSVITILDEEATLRICGKYTYGKPVIGSVKAEFCRRAVRYWYVVRSTDNDICKTYHLTVSIPDYFIVCTCWQSNRILFVYLYFDINAMLLHVTFLCLSVFHASVNKGQLSVPLSQMTNLAPFAQVVVYTVMPSGEAVADSLDFPIQLCLNNKVSLKFSSLQELPAEKTTLSLQAHPGSMCSVRAIDQSVLLLQAEQELNVGILIAAAGLGPSRSSDEQLAGNTKATIRTHFPETWIWELFSVGDSGAVDVEKTVPDTITKWAAGAFCVSSVGFGVSPNTGLTVFQPFFVSLTLPYSVIRGEVFTLKATVFNYLSKCIMVKVTLDDSDQYTFRNCDGCHYTICLCAEESRTFSWIVTPTALGKLNLKVSAEALKTDTLCGNEVATVPDVGRVDTVIRTLLVEVSNCQTISQTLQIKKISLLMPEMFVAGSARASVSVLGDLMGRAMKNLDKLLEMPYGCGEQNMLLFAPNIFILNYLKSTGQLTQKILDKATHFLESGYQRELTYKHDDGSYSAFGKSDASGNTWLTSFVMKSFGGARPYIYVQPQHIKDARRWLSKHQRPDGCIRSVGKLFHNGMKGGVSDDVSLTAYITAALLELDADATDPVVQNCLSCLKAAVAGQLDNLYTTALLSYTFTLAGDQDMRSKLITTLHQKSNTQGGTRHWERAGASKKVLDSLEVEITSYVLLALLSGPAMPDFGLDYSSGIVRWLTQQQNPYGGFASTQDTVVALQALAKYGAATYSPEGSTTVTVTSLGGLNKEFTVDQSNRLLYQEEKLSEVPGEYTIKAQGQSCVLAQVPPSLHDPYMTSTTCEGATLSRCVCVCGCCRYQGRREETNMVIISIKLLSGYILDKSSLSLVNGNKVFVFLQLKKAETQIYSVTLEEDQPVRNLKPAVVKVYDYYQTSDEAVTDYTSACAEST
uniref:Alpha-2-macroglobulin-like 1 n=1 Tax=Amphiprion ocellaris TaxID=80972 RepID=A0AAQ5ZY45_AMPOC